MAGKLGDVAEGLRTATKVLRRAISSASALTSSMTRDEVAMRLSRAVVDVGQAAVEFDRCAGLADPAGDPNTLDAVTLLSFMRFLREENTKPGVLSEWEMQLVVERFRAQGSS